MKRLLKVTAMTGLLTLLRMAMGFVIAKVVAIYTGPTGMAMLGQVQSMVGSLNGIINAPAGSGVVCFTAEMISTHCSAARHQGAQASKPCLGGGGNGVRIAVCCHRHLVQFGDQRPAVISPLCRPGHAFGADLGRCNAGHDCFAKY